MRSAATSSVRRSSIAAKLTGGCRRCARPRPKPGAAGRPFSRPSRASGAGPAPRALDRFSYVVQALHRAPTIAARYSRRSCSLLRRSSTSRACTSTPATLRRDGAQEPDLAARELPAPQRLHDQHAERRAALEDRDAEERVVALLARLREELVARVGHGIDDHHRLELLDDHAGEALADAHRHLADGAAVEAGGGAQGEALRRAGLEQIDRAHVGARCAGRSPRRCAAAPPGGPPSARVASVTSSRTREAVTATPPSTPGASRLGPAAGLRVSAFIGASDLSRRSR